MPCAVVMRLQALSSNPLSTEPIWRLVEEQAALGKEAERLRWKREAALPRVGGLG